MTSKNFDLFEYNVFKKGSENSRRWSQGETEHCVEILSDLDNGFEKILEKLALKKSSNNEVFMHIQQGFMNAVKLDSFKEINEKYFQDKNSIVSNYAEIAIGIE